MSDPAGQPEQPNPFAALLHQAHPGTEHSVRLEADPTGGDVVLQIDAQWFAGGKLHGFKQDAAVMPIGAVRIDRERDASGRVARIRVSLELTNFPN